MRKILISLIGLSLIFIAVGFARETSTVGVKVVHQSHPEIHRAIRKLKDARLELERPNHRLMGHRLKAVTEINAALHELDALEDEKR